MARRRKREAIGQGLLAAQQALAPVLGAWAQSKRLDQTQQAIGDRQQNLDLVNYSQSLQDRVSKGELDPAQASAMFRSQTGQSHDFEAYAPNLSRRAGGISKELADVTDLKNLPSEGQVRRRAQEERLPMDPVMGQTDQYDDIEPVPAEAPPTIKQARGFGPSEPPELASLLSELKGRRSTLEAFEPTVEREEIDPLTGATTKRDIRQSQLASQPSRRTERTGMEQGRRESDIETSTRPGTIARKLEEQTALAPGEVRLAGQKKNAELAAELNSLGITGQQQSAALQLADDFSQESRAFYIAQEQMRRISGLLKEDSPASDIGIVYGFMKMNDPTSSVMQGEQATATNATSTPDWIRNLYNQALTGGNLNPSQRQDFARQAANLYRSGVSEHQMRIQDYSSRASQLRVPPSLVIRQAATDIPLDETAGAGAGGSALDAVRARARGQGPGPGTGPGR